MALEDVKKEIIRKADDETKIVLDAAKLKADNLLSEARQKLEELKEKKDSEIKVTIVNIEKREISTANLSAKKLVMQSKKESLDKAFEEASKKIQGLNDSKKKEILKKIFDKASKEIEVETIYCNKNDAKLVPSGKHKVEAKNIIGGLIFVSKDKSISLDYSFDTIIENIRVKDLAVIANILF